MILMFALKGLSHGANLKLLHSFDIGNSTVRIEATKERDAVGTLSTLPIGNSV